MNPKEECNKSSIVFAFLFVLPGFVDVFAEMKAEQPSFFFYMFIYSVWKLFSVYRLPVSYLNLMAE